MEKGRGDTTRAQKRSERARGSFVRGTVSGTALRPATLFSWAGTRLNARLPQYRWNLGRPPPSWLHSTLTQLRRRVAMLNNTGDGGAAIPSAFSCPCHDLSRPYPTPKRHSRNLTSSRLTCVNFHRSYLAFTTLINIHLAGQNRRFLTIFTMRGMLDNNVDSFLFLKRFKLEIVYGC